MGLIPLIFPNRERARRDIHVFIQQIFIAHLLCDRCCERHRNEDCPLRADSLVERVKKKKRTNNYANKHRKECVDVRGCNREA